MLKLTKFFQDLFLTANILLKQQHTGKIDLPGCRSVFSSTISQKSFFFNYSGVSKHPSIPSINQSTNKSQSMIGPCYSLEKVRLYPGCWLTGLCRTSPCAESPHPGGARWHRPGFLQYFGVVLFSSTGLVDSLVNSDDRGLSLVEAVKDGCGPPNAICDPTYLWRGTCTLQFPRVGRQSIPDLTVRPVSPLIHPHLPHRRAWAEGQLDRKNPFPSILH